MPHRAVAKHDDAHTVTIEHLLQALAQSIGDAEQTWIKALFFDRVQGCERGRATERVALQRQPDMLETVAHAMAEQAHLDEALVLRAARRVAEQLAQAQEHGR